MKARHKKRRLERRQIHARESRGRSVTRTYADGTTATHVAGPRPRPSWHKANALRRKESP